MLSESLIHTVRVTTAAENANTQIGAIASADMNVY